MGYISRYRKEAQEKNLQNWKYFYIAEIEKTCGAILVYRNPHRIWIGGKLKITFNEYPDLPKLFPSYEDAFAWLEKNLNRLSCVPQCP